MITTTAVSGGTWTAWIMSTSFADWITAGGTLIGVLVAGTGLAFVVRELHHSRSGNFVAAWSGIVDRMQAEGDLRQGEKNNRAGRFFMRALYGEARRRDRADPNRQAAKASEPRSRERTRPIPVADWTTVFQSMPQHVQKHKWYESIQRDDTSALLERIARDAFDEMDISGIILLHGSVPGLVRVFVAEYHASIIACWEQGAEFYKSRVRELGFGRRGRPIRKDLYCCFSVLYVLAKRYEQVEEDHYPRFPWTERRKLRVSTSVFRQAERVRQELIDEVRREQAAGQSQKDGKSAPE